jgi:hypothetical protein
MISHLYRFRPIDAVLDGYEELAKQEIYFSPPEELKDPMEGYKDVFWLGDRIVWRNLLRHYLLCLLHTAFRSLLIGAKYDRADLKAIVFSAPNDLPQAPVRAIYQGMCEDFLADPNIQKFLESLSARSTPMRRDELTHHIRALHAFALTVLIRQLTRQGLDGIFRNLEVLHSLAAKMNETTAQVVALQPPEHEAIEALYSSSELIVAQMELIHDYNNAIPAEAQAITFFTRDFPASYVRALDELIHPPCFTACFVENPANASMWATYAGSHRGVCLKFKTTPDSVDRPALNLNAIRGWRGGKGVEMEPIHSFALHTFFKVNYSDAYPEIDFFSSLGRLPIPTLNAVWYNGEESERSSCRTARVYDTDAWRRKYWDDFQAGATCKTSEWLHEQEYRLLLPATFNEFKEKASRKLCYKFSDLSGIIFGAQTSAEDKLKIMKIIDEKCQAEGRQDFEFYQAQYSRKSRSFRIMSLGLIRYESADTDVSARSALPVGVS